MLRRPHYIALGLIVLLTLVTLNLPGHTTARLKLGIGSLFLPLFGLAGSTQQATGIVEDAVVTKRELLKLNEGLRRENERLQLQAMQGEEAARENARLRQLVGWQLQTSWKLKLARVVLRDPANWWRTVQIDLGSRDGLRENLPVRTAAGLVGRVSSVSLTRSQIVLIGDPKCRVSATVENPARDIGVIVASGPVDTSLVDLTYLASSANLKAGQIVVTSGLGGVFPKGIPIGQIVDSRSVEYGLYTDARVKLNANLGSLEQVWVLMNPFQ